MKKTHGIPAVFKQMVFCLLICLLLSTAALGAEEQATVDDLFEFFLENWANELNISISDASGFTEHFIPGLALVSNRFNVCKAFSEMIITVEDTYGHLPEYWELRSILDRKPENDLFTDPENANLDYLFSNDIGDPRLNPDILQKALDIDPDRGSLRYYIGKLELIEKYLGSINGPYPDGSENYKEYCIELAGVYSDAAAAEPGNAFYPVYEAVYLYNGGNSSVALNALERAGLCDYWSYPRIFPSTYVLGKVVEFEGREAPFDDITPGARFSIFSSFFLGMDALPNYIQVKNMYKGLIAEADEDDLHDLLTDLHRTACVMGKGEGNESINALVAAILVKICLREAMHSAGESGNSDLERAVIAAIAEIDSTKEIHKASRVSDEKSTLTFTFAYIILIDVLDRLMDGITDYTYEIRLSEVLPPVLLFRVSWQIHEELIKPVFEELETFDYSKPGEWYDNWFQKMFPEPGE